MNYRVSQEHIDAAERALANNDPASASVHYAEAAKAQREMVDALPLWRAVTRSVFGLSAASLYHRAGDVGEARAYGEWLLKQPWLKPREAEKTRELLARIERGTCS